MLKNRLKDVKIARKIILIPIMAIIAFGLIFLITFIIGSWNNAHLVKLQDGYYPALEMSRELDELLATIQRSMQYAVSAMDEDMLNETDELQSRFLDLVKTGKVNEVLNQTLLDSVKTEFETYYPLARETTLSMLSGDLGEAMVSRLDQMREKYNSIQGMLSKLRELQKTDMAGSISDAHRNMYILGFSILFITIISILIQLFLSRLLTSSITLPLQKVVQASNAIAEGDLAVELPATSGDEIGELSRATELLVEANSSLSQAADAIGQGHYDVAVVVRGEKDILGNAIERMKNNLMKMDEENKRQDWFKTGQADLANKMRGDQTVVDLSRNVINYLAVYLNAKVGAIYLKDEADVLKLSGSYAYKKRKNISSEFKIGEGLVGQAALEKQSIVLSEVPDDYIKITSGLGDSTPLNIMVIPLIYDEKISGVIELGSFHLFTDIELQFVEQASENIAISFQSAISRLRVRELLEETQSQAEELQAQQEELRVTNEELQSQQEELRVANEELEEQADNLKKSEEMLKKQQEDLQQSNTELEKQTIILTERQTEIENKNTELERARKEIEKKAAELEITSKYKSEFLANMSHELRTPMNSIQILSRLLFENKENNLTEKQVNFARTIHSSGSDLLELINEILDLSKIEAGKMVLNLEKMSLSHLPKYLQQNFEHLTTEKGLYLKLETDKNIPDAIVTDRQRVEQIIKNLISNAIKFTDKGGITVSIRRPASGECKLPREHSIAISVIDTGIGIPEDKITAIFEAFQQADGTTSRKYGGTGLGLSISRELAKLLGGEIGLISEEAKGSRFTLYLPEEAPAVELSEDQDADTVEVPREIEQAVQEMVGSSPDDPEPAPKTEMKPAEIRDDRRELRDGDNSMLVIEDDRTFAKIIFDIAREKGYKCLIAEDGEAGLQLASQYKPSAIILDIGLPRINGWSVMERLKGDKQLRQIPVFFMSALDKKITAMRMGAIGHLTKPISLEDINIAFNRIEKMLEKKTKQLLVVEDDKVMRDSIIELIGDSDIDITTTEKGTEALKALKDNEFDCVVLDLGLSDISGFHLIEKIKADEEIGDVPIIVYTGKELTKKEDARLRKHAESIIIKGAKSPDRLLDEVLLFLHKVDRDLPEVQIGTNQVSADVFAGRKVLLADDDVRNIFALSSALEEKDIEIVVAENGKEALELLEENDDIDLILMDIMMPEMDGFEAMSKIRKNKNWQKIPIIALTAKAMKGDRQKCIDAGANDYLAKPVDIERLLSILHVWLYK